MIGLGANPAEDAVYPLLVADADARTDSRSDADGSADAALPKAVPAQRVCSRASALASMEFEVLRLTEAQTWGFRNLWSLLHSHVKTAGHAAAVVRELCSVPGVNADAVMVRSHVPLS